MDTKQQLVDALAGLGSTITEAMDVIEGFVPCGHPALTVSNALVALDVDDDAALAQQLETVEGFIDHVSENRGVAAYHGIEVELAGPKADLFAAIREVGASSSKGPANSSRQPIAVPPRLAKARIGII